MRGGGTGEALEVVAAFEHRHDPAAGVRVGKTPSETARLMRDLVA